jgi:AraC-like DNA-binding protein
MTALVEHATFRVMPDLGGLELLHATFITHAFAPHTHEGFVISAILRGAEAFRYRGETHIASAGHVVFINPSEVHTGYAPHAEGWTYSTLYPPAHLLERAWAGIGGLGTPFFSEAVVDDPELHARVAHTTAQLQHPASQLERDERLLALLSFALSRHADTKARSLRPALEHDAVRRARAFLETHVAQNVSLEHLSLETGLSGFHLSRVFRAQMGLPPHAYQTQLRVKLAKRLLLAGNASAHVALEAGFADQSHLTRQFKRVYGVTPARFALGVQE